MKAKRPPRVTVAIPTFNRSAYLDEAARSVLAQTYPDFELLILDNASEDDTPQVAMRLAEEDGRVTYVRHDRNIGFVANQSAAYYGGSGAYGITIGDDDLLEPGHLERLVEILDDDPLVGVAHSSFFVIDADGGSEGETTWMSETADTIDDGDAFLRRSMTDGCPICSSTALIRRAALPPGGLREEDNPAVDFVLWLRIARAGWHFAYVAEPLARYRVHTGSFSAGRHGPAAGGTYVYRTDAIDTIYALKRRFLAEEPVRADARELERLARTGRRRALVWLARSGALAERDTSFRRVRFLRDVARLDAAALLSSMVWRPLIADILPAGSRRR